MFDVLTNILALLFVLGVMIFIHEFGHFAMAKAFGIGVEVFSLGFGKRVAGFKRGDTDYRLSALPLGGYVKMVGENPDEKLRGADNEYLGKPKWQRFLVLVMGPAMNVVLAYVLFTSVYVVGIRVPAEADDPVTIGLIEADTAAASAGLRAGDRVVTINNEIVPNWEQFRLQILISANEELLFGIERGSQRLSIPITPRESDARSRAGYIGVAPPLAPQVGLVEEGGIAEAAGLQPGDLIVAVDGEAVSHFNRMAEALIERADMLTALTVERGGETFETSLTPQTDDAGIVTVGFGADAALLSKIRRYGFGEALVRAGSELRRQTLFVGEVVGRLFTGRMSVRTLSGPIEIARFSGAVARTGSPTALLSFMAMISLQLGLLNLLPIPVLDGGQIAMILFEGVIRRDLSMKVKERIMNVGLIMLVSLMVVVLTLDITKIIPASWLEYLPF